MNKKSILNFFIRNRKGFLVVFLYAIITIVIFFYLLKNIGQALTPGDGLFTYWVLSWDIHSFLHAPLNLFNANIFYPNTNTLAYSEGFFVPALLALPFYFISRNMIIANNLLILLSYIFAAFGAYKLAKYYTKNNYASFIAGLIFGFSTFKLVSIGHFQSIMTFWMPFAILYLQKYLDTKKRKYILYFALLFSAQMLSSWNMGAFFALFVAFLLIANWRIIYNNFFAFTKDSLIALVIIIILVLPFAYPYFKLHQETHFSYPVWEIVNGSADIGGYIIPLPGMYMSKFTTIFGITKQNWVENFNFLGYFSIFLLIYYFLFSRNKISSRNFGIYALGIPVFIIFSFGPVLRFIPSINIPSLYYLAMPALGFVRTPSRLSIIVLLCVSVTVAYIINSIKINNRKIKIILGILAPLFILYEFWVPRGPMFTNTVCPDVYSQIKNDNSISAIAELPVYTGATADHNLEYLYYSTCDNFKPIFNGYSGYFPADYGLNSDILRTFPDAESIEFMNRTGISHVLLHADDFEEAKQKPLLETVKQNKKLRIEYQEGKDYLIKVNN